MTAVGVFGNASGDAALLALIDRVEVIDSTGRAFVEYYEKPGVTISMQDGGRTMKIFTGAPAPARSRESLALEGETDLLIESPTTAFTRLGDDL